MKKVNFLALAIILVCFVWPQVSQAVVSTCLSDISCPAGQFCWEHSVIKCVGSGMLTCSPANREMVSSCAYPCSREHPETCTNAKSCYGSFCRGANVCIQGRCFPKLVKKVGETCGLGSSANVVGSCDKKLVCQPQTATTTNVTQGVCVPDTNYDPTSLPVRKEGEYCDRDYRGSKEVRYSFGLCGAGLKCIEDKNNHYGYLSTSTDRGLIYMMKTLDRCFPESWSEVNTGSCRITNPTACRTCTYEASCPVNYACTAVANRCINYINSKGQTARYCPPVATTKRCIPLEAKL
jgi:hypothetical protein